MTTSPALLSILRCLVKFSFIDMESHEGTNPLKRRAAATVKSFVIFFTFDCHVNCWPARDFFQLDSRVANIIYVRRFSSIRRTWPSHWGRAFSVGLKIHWRTSLLVIFCFQQIRPMDLRHLWLKTCSPWRSFACIDYVSQPRIGVGRTVQLYARSLAFRLSCSIST